MKKILAIVTLLCTLLSAEEILHVSDFEVSLFSKIEEAPVQVNASIIFEGRDVEIYDFKIIDTLNVVISSFYAENLLTSKGKQSLKEAMKNYARDRYAIDIDAVYIQKLHVRQVNDAKDVIKALKEEGCCNAN